MPSLRLALIAYLLTCVTCGEFRMITRVNLIGSPLLPHLSSISVYFRWSIMGLDTALLDYGLWTMVLETRVWQLFQVSCSLLNSSSLLMSLEGLCVAVYPPSNVS